MAETTGVKPSHASDPNEDFLHDTSSEYTTPFVNSISNDNFSYYNNKIENECIPCSHIESYPDCPGYHKSQCFHNEECKTGHCDCEKLTMELSSIGMDVYLTSRFKADTVWNKCA